MRWLVVYDIRDPRRLAKVAAILKDFGERVQKSKFEADLDDRELADLIARLIPVISIEEDGVKLIPLCALCMEKVEVFGQGARIAPPPTFEVV